MCVYSSTPSLPSQEFTFFRLLAMRHAPDRHAGLMDVGPAHRGGGVELCEFFEGYAANGSDAAMPDGIYSLDDLKEFGREKG